MLMGLLRDCARWQSHVDWGSLKCECLFLDRLIIYTVCTQDWGMSDKLLRECPVRWVKQNDRDFDMAHELSKMEKKQLQDAMAHVAYKQNLGTA